MKKVISLILILLFIKSSVFATNWIEIKKGSDVFIDSDLYTFAKNEKKEVVCNYQMKCIIEKGQYILIEFQYDLNKNTERIIKKSLYNSANECIYSDTNSTKWIERNPTEIRYSTIYQVYKLQQKLQKK